MTSCNHGSEVAVNFGSLSLSSVEGQMTFNRVVNIKVVMETWKACLCNNSSPGRLFCFTGCGCYLFIYNNPKLPSKECLRTLTRSITSVSWNKKVGFTSLILKKSQELVYVDAQITFLVCLHLDALIFQYACTCMAIKKLYSLILPKFHNKWNLIYAVKTACFALTNGWMDDSGTILKLF